MQYKKKSVASWIRTRIIIVESKDADHYTTIMALLQSRLMIKCFVSLLLLMKLEDKQKSLKKLII